MDKSTYRIFHNPHFLFYGLQPDHSRIVIPQQPVATVQIDLNSHLPPLEQVYIASQHLDGTPWFCRRHVLLHVRSTSTGDVIQAPDGQFHVVESFGFKPLQPSRPTTASDLVRAAYKKLCAAGDHSFQDKKLVEEAWLLLGQTVELLNELPAEHGPSPEEQWD